MVHPAPPKELAFEVVEYRQRLGRVRKMMQERDLECFVTNTPENILYMTGHQTPGYYMYQCLVVPPNNDPVLVLRRGELGNFLRYSYLDKAETYTDIQDPAELTAQVIRDCGLAKGRVGVEYGSWFLTPKHYETLKASLPGAKIVDATGTIERCRVVKSPREVEYMREAARSTEAAMRAAIDAIHVGVSDNIVSAELHRALFATGSEYVALGPFVAAGFRSTIMHGNWGRQKISRGDSILIEIAGCIQRYNAALMRTVSVGPPSPRLAHMAKAAEEANRASYEAMRPGVTCGEIHSRCQEVFEKAGLIELRRANRSGYSIGLAFPPDWGEGHILSLQEKESTVLEPGMVFHNPTAIREYGVHGASFSETVLITETGYELLTNFERKLFVCE